MNRIIFWIVFFGVIGLLVWGMVASTRGKENTAHGALAVPVSTEDWSNNATSTVVLVEYSDFQCPACKAFQPIVKEVVASTGVRFVYRHFPLITIHQNADYAAAAEAAGIQGKFWEMHDMLFETQDEWATSNEALKIFSAYAEKLGLDTKKFDVDKISREVRQKVNDDYKGGSSAGVIGTPTFFLNGTMMENPKSPEEFKTLIQNAVASSTKI